MNIRLREKHPRAIRWTHWINFPILSLMIWSGILIYWADGPLEPVFFPNWFYNWFGLDHRLADGMAFHFTLMWIFTANGIVYAFYLLFSGEWKILFPDRHSWREAILVALHDMGLRKQLPPQGKFNAAQRISYTVIFFMGIGSLLTGLAIYKPVQLYWLTWLFGGYSSARYIHFFLTMGYCAFFVVHIAQVVRAGWNNFQSMVTGFEVVKDE
jgi:thiosulfate reductase cytochrome b subunit